MSGLEVRSLAGQRVSAPIHDSEFGVGTRKWSKMTNSGTVACIAARAEPPYIREQALGCIGSDTCQKIIGRGSDIR